MAITGVNVLTAAKLLGEIGDITRFRSLRPAQRHRTHPRLERQRRPTPAQPRRQPAAQHPCTASPSPKPAATKAPERC
ncbi:hypothetical protein [Nonomuraea africana]|uniref:hypothetical protein n=1 Tax=Nonomuraea africana TaxID=46171 RepID=UPI00178A0F6C